MIRHEEDRFLAAEMGWWPDAGIRLAMTAAILVAAYGYVVSGWSGVLRPLSPPAQPGLTAEIDDEFEAYLRGVHDYWTLEVGPCLRAHGYQIEPLPSYEQWTPLEMLAAWDDPYGVLGEGATRAERERILKACPTEPPHLKPPPPTVDPEELEAEEELWRAVYDYWLNQLGPCLARHGYPVGPLPPYEPNWVETVAINTGDPYQVLTEASDAEFDRILTLCPSVPPELADRVD